MKTTQVNPRLLAVDDDSTALAYYRGFCSRFQMDLTEARNAQEAIRLVSDAMQVALIDLNMPGIGGIELISELRHRFPRLQVIIISSSESFTDAVRAIRLGVFDFLEKPVSFAKLAETIGRSLARYREMTESSLPALPSSLTSAALSSESIAEPRWREELKAVSRIDATVLLTGETGTGKSQAARFIHEQSQRHDGPFVSINCSALPSELIESELFGHRRGAFTGALEDRPGRAELADGGTLFLDEIGDLPLELQPKLLTFLQDRTASRLGSNFPYRVNCRVIAATHRDLRQQCREKSFREDLYFRLDVMSVHLPPLRDRQDEIPEIVSLLIAQICQRHRRSLIPIDPAAMSELREYPWPGNIRELENVLERSISFCDDPILTRHHLRFQRGVASSEIPVKPAAAFVLAGRTLAEIERQAILETLLRENGNKARAARSLGISEKSIYNKMRRLHITAKPTDEAARRQVEIEFLTNH